MHGLGRRVARTATRLPARTIAGRRYGYPSQFRSLHRSATLLQQPRDPLDPQNPTHEDPTNGRTEKTGTQPSPPVGQEKEVIDGDESIATLRDKLHKALKEADQYRSRLASKISFGVLPAPQESPDPPSIPPWFYERNVKLKQEQPTNDDVGPSARCSLQVKYKSTGEEEVPPFSFDMPKFILLDILESLSYDHKTQLLSQEEADFFKVLKRDAHGMTPENEGTREERTSEEIKEDGEEKLHFSIYFEAYAAVTASLSMAGRGVPHNFSSGKSNLVLHCPVNGGLQLLDEVIEGISSREGIDIVQLDPQDIAELGGEYMGDGDLPSIRSIRNIGYDTYRPEIEEYQQDDEDDENPMESHTESSLPPREQVKPAVIGVKTIRLSVPLNKNPVLHNIMSSMGKIANVLGGRDTAMSNFQPFASAPKPDSALPSDMVKLTALLEALIDAAKTKQYSPKVETDASSHPEAPLAQGSHSGQETRQTIDVTKLFGCNTDSGFSMVLDVDPTQSLPEESASIEQHKKTIIVLRDFKELQMTQYGESIVAILTRIVHERRRRGEQIMIIGTSSSADLVPELSRSGITHLQHENAETLFRTICMAPGLGSLPIDSDAPEELAPAVDEPEAIEDVWYRNDRKRIKEINLRHLCDMVRQLGVPDEETSFNGRTVNFPFITPDLAVLENRLLTHDEVHRVTLTAIGFQQANLDKTKLHPLHLLLSMSLLRYSDEIKHIWTENERELQKEAGGAVHSHETHHQKAKQEADKRLEKVRETCNTHEKRLLSGVVNPHNLKTTFADVHSPPETIEALKSLTSLSLLRPDAFKYGVLATDKIPGLLLYGPPGTGKTLLAKAVAKESGATVLEVSGSEVNDMYVGEGEKNVKAIFTLARKLSPCVVFIDEADAIFGSRSGPSNRTSHREIINQFLREWDGMNDQSVFIMVATNRPFDLDDAALRRLPRRLLVDLPVEKDREAILGIHLKGENLSPSVSLLDLAARTPFYSGSDLKNLSVAAALACIREENEASAKAKESGEEYAFPEKRTLMQHHFDKAMEEISASISEDMTSLSAIRKFDEQYGDRKGRRKKRGWGFATSATEGDLKGETARVRT